MRKWTGESVFESVLFTTIALLLVLVMVTGWSVYSRLSEVSDTPLPSIQSENLGFITRELNISILKSDNLCYAFLYKENEEALKDFDNLASQTKRDLKLLKFYVKTDELLTKQVKQLEKMIVRRFANLDTLMGIKNERRVDETMRIVTNEVEQASLETNLHLQIKEAAAQEGESKKKWFQRKDKVKNQEPIVNATEIADQSADKITNKLSMVRKAVVSKEINQNLLRYQLEEGNNELSKKIAQLFQLIDSAEKKSLLNKTIEVKRTANETNHIILLFTFVSTIFIVLIVVLIVTLFRKSKRTNYQLQSAKEKTEFLTEAKSRFIATMSHEIRTPLNAISGFTDQLYYEQLPENISDKVKIIQSSVKHLVQISNEILDLSKLENNEIQFENIPFSPSQEVLEIKDQFQFLLLERNNALELLLAENVPTILGDPLRFRQVVINLISNANKFTKAGKITVKLEQMKMKGDDFLQITVLDQGIGIDPKQLERIFEPFEQADESVARNYGGTGLGLSITKRIVEAQKGHIQVESERNKGSKFIVQWPLILANKDNNETTIPAQTDFAFLNGKTILIADDEPFNRILLKSFFHTVNVNILEAENGLIALDLITRNSIDIALLDVRMPEMNGHELVAEIKNSTVQFPIIGLTATLTPDKKERMILSGWTNVLAKPIQPAQLKQVILQAMDDMHSTSDQVNLEGLKTLTDNDDTFYNELIDTFIQSTEKGLIQIKFALEESNWKQLGEIAHQLAAPFKHFEAINCYNTLKEIEQFGRSESNVDALPQLVKKFHLQATAVIEQIKNKR